MHILNYYQNNINSDKVKLKTFKEGELPWFFDIELETLEEKEELKNYLDKNNIETRDCYPALSTQNYLNNYKNNELSFSEEICNKILWLPSGNNLNDEQLSYICKTLANFK